MFDSFLAVLLEHKIGIFVVENLNDKPSKMSLQTELKHFNLKF